MVEVDRSTGTVYLNAAQVPRIRSFPSTGGSGGGGGARLRQPHESSYEEDSAGEVDEAAAGSSGDSGSMRGHHFLVVELQLGIVTAARDVWVGVQPGGAAGGAGRRCVVLQQQELLKTSLPAAALGGTPGADGASGDGSSGGGTAGEAAAQGSSSGGGTSGDEYVCSIYRAFTGEWEPLVLPLPEEARQAGAA